MYFCFLQMMTKSAVQKGMFNEIHRRRRRRRLFRSCLDDESS